MNLDKLTKLEKAALISAMIGAVFNVFLFALGKQLHATDADMTLGILRIAAALLTAASFDLVVVATVAGMRAGRRSHWSIATAVAGAVVSALIALDVAGVWSQPWLHAANSLIVLVFMLHLAAPRTSSRSAQLRRLVRRLVVSLRQSRTDLIHERATTDQIAAQLRQALERVRQLEAQSNQSETVEVIIVGGREYSLRQIADITGTPLTTLRRKVNQLPAPRGAEEA